MKKGTTLIEVIVASVILAIVIGGLMMLFATNYGTIKVNQHRNEANHLINTTFESFSAVHNRAEIIQIINDFKADNEIDFVGIDGMNTKYTITFTEERPRFISNANEYAGDITADLSVYEVRMKVSWTRNGRTEDIEATYIFQPPI